ncbi:MAG: T9SS type A sorting domain-containing protein [Flavobacteriales bacterium]|nr:T9SS type A sorting domain-containing protein [Flavobacteriales bacterium]
MKPLMCFFIFFSIIGVVCSQNSFQLDLFPERHLLFETNDNNLLIVSQNNNETRVRKCSINGMVLFEDTIHFPYTLSRNLNNGGLRFNGGEHYLIHGRKNGFSQAILANALLDEIGNIIWIKSDTLYSNNIDWSVHKISDTAWVSIHKIQSTISIKVQSSNTGQAIFSLNNIYASENNLFTTDESNLYNYKSNLASYSFSQYNFTNDSLLNISNYYQELDFYGLPPFQNGSSINGKFYNSIKEGSRIYQAGKFVLNNWNTQEIKHLFTFFQHDTSGNFTDIKGYEVDWFGAISNNFKLFLSDNDYLYLITSRTGQGLVEEYFLSVFNHDLDYLCKKKIANYIENPGYGFYNGAYYLPFLLNNKIEYRILNGCVGESFFSTQEFQNAPQAFVISPNPASEFIFIEGVKDLLGVEYYITDVKGNLIKRNCFKQDSPITLDVSDMISGTYVFLFLYEGKLQSQIFIKK